MSWYDVYDNIEVQLVTRKKAAALTGAAIVVLACAVLMIAWGLIQRLPSCPVLVLGLAAAGSFMWWFTRRIGRQRRIVWCVKLSREEIDGYDYARRRRSIPWRKVERVDIV